VGAKRPCSAQHQLPRLDPLRPLRMDHRFCNGSPAVLWWPPLNGGNQCSAVVRPAGVNASTWPVVAGQARIVSNRGCHALPFDGRIAARSAWHAAPGASPRVDRTQSSLRERRSWSAERRAKSQNLAPMLGTWTTPAGLLLRVVR
jgi:hypothetical protein